MNDRNTIVVLFEDLTIRQEVIQYAAALARRLRAGITLLMLLPPETRPDVRSPDAVERGMCLLDREATFLADGGVTVRREVIAGEPRSELIKYLATRPAFHALVWGGDRSALAPGSRGPSGHWLATLRSELGCPLLVPARR